MGRDRGGGGQYTQVVSDGECALAPGNRRHKGCIQSFREGPKPLSAKRGSADEAGCQGDGAIPNVGDNRFDKSGFDADKIEGDTLTLGVGEKDEPYEAIGRGLLNIEGLPVFRDSVGGIGTPTSDNERTKLSEDTRRLLMTINMYGDSEMTAEETENMARELFGKYAGASDIRISYWKP